MGLMAILTKQPKLAAATPSVEQLTIGHVNFAVTTNDAMCAKDIERVRGMLLTQAKKEYERTPGMHQQKCAAVASKLQSPLVDAVSTLYGALVSSHAGKFKYPDEAAWRGFDPTMLRSVDATAIIEAVTNPAQAMSGAKNR